jgi:uncharacterized membrane protein SpoIIM required for sporulation
LIRKTEEKKFSIEIIATIVIPVLFFVIGILISLNQIFSQKNLHLKIVLKPSSFWNTFWAVLLNNFKVNFLIIISGFGFYIMAIGIVGVNMILFGSSVAINLYKNSGFDTLVKYLHALIEIPAIIISLFVSFRISTFMIKSLQDKRDSDWKCDIKRLSKYVLLAFLLLITAATIESIIINYF